MLTETTTIVMPRDMETQPGVVTPSSLPPALANCSSNIGLEETPPEKQKVKRKPPDDCHIIIH
jgi:hypothetical protein